MSTENPEQKATSSNTDNANQTPIPSEKTKNKNPKKKIGKRELLSRLIETNQQLKKLVNDHIQRIIAIEAQNRLLESQLSQLVNLQNKFNPNLPK